MNHLSRFRVRCLALSVTGIAALIVTASAFAWQYTYVDAGTYAAPGQYFGSPSNANLDYNEIGWFVAGSADLTLCNTAGACYARTVIPPGMCKIYERSPTGLHGVAATLAIATQLRSDIATSRMSCNNSTLNRTEE